MLIRRIKHAYNIKAVKEDLRKIGVNFITAGAVGLAITHISDLTLVASCASILVILAGTCALFLGYSKGHK